MVFGFLCSLALGQTQFAELAKQYLPKDSDYTQALALGDVDGDGDLDLISANDSENNAGPSNGVHVNRHRQLASPVFAKLALPYSLNFYAEPGYGVTDHLLIPLLATRAKKTKDATLGDLRPGPKPDDHPSCGTVVPTHGADHAAVRDA